MTDKTDDRMLASGSRCAMAALMAQKARIDSLPERERLHWWCGFLTAAMGGAMASLGEPAMRAVRQTLAESTDQSPESDEPRRPRRRSYLKR